MEKYFGNSYRGDPGVPHCDEDAFSNVWLGSMGFGVYAWNFPYFWTLARARKYTLDSSLFFCFYPLYNCHLFLWFFFSYSWLFIIPIWGSLGFNLKPTFLPAFFLFKGQIYLFQGVRVSWMIVSVWKAWISRFFFFFFWCGRGEVGG